MTSWPQISLDYGRFTAVIIHAVSKSPRVEQIGGGSLCIVEIYPFRVRICLGRTLKCPDSLSMNSSHPLWGVGGPEGHRGETSARQLESTDDERSYLRPYPSKGHFTLYTLNVCHTILLLIVSGRGMATSVAAKSDRGDGPDCRKPNK